MSDMTPTIVPKSDQLNSDDLISGPITIKVTGVSIKTGEQPVSIFYEGDNGKPYKCCKSMARVLVNAWGADSKQYVGRSMTLYRDPTVKWAGMEVGGIRISHMSDIDESLTMALTMTRSNRKPFTVRPLTTVAAKPKAAPQPLPSADPVLALPLPSAAGAAPSANPASPQLNAIIAAIEEVRGQKSAANVADMIKLLSDESERKFATESLEWQIEDLKKRSAEEAAL